MPVYRRTACQVSRTDPSYIAARFRRVWPFSASFWWTTISSVEAMSGNLPLGVTVVKDYYRQVNPRRVAGGPELLVLSGQRVRRHSRSSDSLRWSWSSTGQDHVTFHVNPTSHLGQRHLDGGVFPDPQVGGLD